MNAGMIDGPTELLKQCNLLVSRNSLHQRQKHLEQAWLLLDAAIQSGTHCAAHIGVLSFYTLHETWALQLQYGKTIFPAELAVHVLSFAVRALIESNDMRSGMLLLHVLEYFASLPGGAEQIVGQLDLRSLLRCQGPELWHIHVKRVMHACGLPLQPATVPLWRRFWSRPAVGPLRILCLDGGGLRGIVSISVLRHLERVCGVPLWQLFDLILGTSTGSILASAIALKRMNATECLEMYRTLGSTVFPEWSPVGFLNMGKYVLRPYDQRCMCRAIRTTT